MKRDALIKRTLAGVVVLSAAACGDSDGNVTVTTYGEDFIELSIPAANGPDGEGFVDGAELVYSKFLVNFTDLRIADRDGQVGATLGPVGVWDLRQTGPHLMTELPLGAQTWEDVGITIRPNPSAVSGNVSQSDLTEMLARGASAWTVGTVTYQGVTYSFDWSFTTQTRYVNCADGDGVPGIVVPDGGQVSMEITVHGDHLFFDDLQAEGSALRFAAIASADANADQVITLEELAAIDLTDLPSDQYGTGGDSSITNLRQYVEAQTNSLIHFNGEGDCQQQRL